jgi:hypothetical protein
MARRYSVERYWVFAPRSAAACLVLYASLVLLALPGVGQAEATGEIAFGDDDEHKYNRDYYIKLDECYDSVQHLLKLPESTQEHRRRTVHLDRQVTAFRKLRPFLNNASDVLDIGFGGGLVLAMMLHSTPSHATLWGVDFPNRMGIASRNLFGVCQACRADWCKALDPPAVPRGRLKLYGADWFNVRHRGWPSAESSKSSAAFGGWNVIYSGCCLDAQTKQLDVLLGSLAKGGAAVFSYGLSDQQVLWFVSSDGSCEQLQEDLIPIELCESGQLPRNEEAVERWSRFATQSTSVTTRRHYWSMVTTLMD